MMGLIFTIGFMVTVVVVLILVLFTKKDTAAAVGLVLGVVLFCCALVTLAVTG